MTHLLKSFNDYDIIGDPFEGIKQLTVINGRFVSVLMTEMPIRNTAKTE